MTKDENTALEVLIRYALRGVLTNKTDRLFIAQVMKIKTRMPERSLTLRAHHELLRILHDSRDFHSQCICRKCKRNTK